MRKTIVILVALCATMAAQATILRVSNVSGSTAPYSTVEAALDAAAEGDTIMLDASGTDYGWLDITKRVVVIGPGYWLQANGIIQEGVEYARADGVNVKTSGVTVCGLYLKGMDADVNIWDGCTNTVVKRCHIGGCINIGQNADRCAILQNYVIMQNNIPQIGEGGSSSSHHQITNNIFASYFNLRNIHDCYFAYNTILKNGTINIWNNSSNITFEKNIWPEQPGQPDNETCNFSDNLIMEIPEEGTDKDLRDKNYSTTHGAFAGDSPYVISGVPSAPVIEDLQVPTTAEYGSKMNVTIKVSIQQ